MASNDQTSKRTHFFKIILPHMLFEGKLMIPKKFVHEYGEDLSTSASLKLPSGEEWDVNLEKCGNDVWFQKGWKEFADCYSLAYGHLLVFRYERPSFFHVLIFDASAFEIDYISDRIESREAGNNKKFQAPEDGMLDENSQTCQQKRCNSSISFLRPCKIRRTKLGDDLETSRSLPEEALRCTSTKREVLLTELPGGAGNQIIDQNTRSPFIRNSGAYEANGEFKSKYPFFRVLITSRQKYYKRLPTKFLMRHMKDDGQAVMLQVGTRSWRIKLIHSRQYAQSFFGAGWVAFARENALEAGDVCFFELLCSDGDDIVMKVSIFKNTSVCGNGNTESTLDSQKTDISHVNGECKAIPLFGSQSANLAEGSRDMPPYNFRKPEAVWRFQQNITGKRNVALERADTFQSKNPFVPIVMKGSYVGLNTQGALNIPFKFANRHFHSKNNGDVIFLRAADGRVWTMRLTIRAMNVTNTRYELSRHGWSSFARGNNLKIGDVCVFELISSAETTFQVFIYRNTDSTNCPFSQESDQGTDITNLNFQRTSFSDFEASGNPYFRVKLGRGRSVRLPNSFMRKHIKHGGDFVLQVGAKFWRVKLIYYDVSSGHISAGWGAFLRENDLQVGDICLFELINREENVMKVSISRHISAE